jgi:type IV pilus assembly protein PilW
MTTRTSPRRSLGFTLIELMIALLVGAVVILSVVTVQGAFESQRRTATSGTDLDSASAYAVGQLDGILRSAGAGFTQAYSQTYGCKLYSNTGSLPAPTLAEPFSNVLSALGGNIRVAPVVILPANTDSSQLWDSTSSSDVIMVMGGSGSGANLQTQFSAAPSATDLYLQNTASFAPNDVVLIMDATGAAGPANCLVEQVATGFVTGAGVTDLTLGGTYYSTAALSPSTFTLQGAAVTIGNPTAYNYPNFQLIGVGANNQLTSYDLLNLTGSTPVTLADEVMEMHALYLISSSTSASGFIGVDPSKTVSPGYTPSTLLAGTLAASTTINTIKAIRVGLILKSPLLEKTQVASPTLTMFSDLVDASGAAMTYTRTITSTGSTCPGSGSQVNCEANYRYRAVELTIPLRNPLIY